MSSAEFSVAILVSCFSYLPGCSKHQITFSLTNSLLSHLPPLCLQETEEEEDESSDSSESGESSTPAPATVIPVVITEAPVAETTPEAILPTIVTDTETARGDNLGGYPSDYKSIVYVEDKSYHKVPAPYKSYEFVGTGKKMAYDMTDGNEVEKSLQVYKVQTSLSFLTVLGLVTVECAAASNYHCQTVQ